MGRNRRRAVFTFSHDFSRWVIMEVGLWYTPPHAKTHLLEEFSP